MTPDPTSPPAPTRADLIGRGLYFALLFVAIFTFPVYPQTELDSSWRQVLTYAFVEGWQFGRDIIFTYGPLGWMMGNTYSGIFFWPFMVWQVVAGLIFATLIFRQGLRLTPYPRALFWTIMVTFGVTYVDALHMIVIALLGFELVRDAGGPPRRWTLASLVLLAVLAAIKFTNLMLAGFVVGVAAVLELALRRPRAAARLALVFGGAFLLVWVLCRQNPLHLPAYFLHSLEVSSGYGHTMGLPTSDYALRAGLPVLLILIAYAGLHLLVAPEKPRALARCLVLGGFVYLNWKHGFVRADGHLIGFHICALFALTAFPALLDDPPRLRWVRWVLLLPGVGFCLAGLQDPLPLTRNMVWLFHEKIVTTVQQAANFRDHYETYRTRLRAVRQEWELSRTRAVVGDRTVDFVSYTPAIVLHNRMNYRPRPVIQSYSAYTPKLARINADFLASDRAPEFILFRLETIDGRYPSLDDSELMNLLVHRYEFVHTEKGIQLWRRLPGPFDDDDFAPRPLATQELAVNEPFAVDGTASQRLWVSIDLRPTLLGRLRTFLYKPPFVHLELTDLRGLTSSYRLPLPQARTGFLLSPIIDDQFAYLRFASDLPNRPVGSFRVVVAEEDRRYLAPTATIRLATVPRSNAGAAYLTEATRAQFPVFRAVPIAFEAQSPPSPAEVDGTKVVVMHAPSELVFQRPEGARRVSGRFGFLPGAYLDGGNTNGAEFIVYWSNGAERIELFKRYLSPVPEPKDRGLQAFDVALPEREGGRVFLQITAGAENNFAWDWTAWTDVAIE